MISFSKFKFNFADSKQQQQQQQQKKRQLKKSNNFTDFKQLKKVIILLTLNSSKKVIILLTLNNNTVSQASFGYLLLTVQHLCYLQDAMPLQRSLELPTHPPLLQVLRIWESVFYS